MLKLPNAVGLILCHQVIVEETTHNVTLVNTFNLLKCISFPSPPQRIILYAVLTDGLGDARMSVAISRMDTLEEVYERQWPMRFSDSLRRMQFTARLGGIVFPVPGAYQVSLLADREWVAQTVLKVSS